jgi:hypothetical protein
MITIKKDSVNRCFFTLEEKRTLPDANYLLQLRSNNTQSNKDLVLPLSANTTTNVLRYDSFNIEEVPLSGESLDNRQINLSIGSYDYYVWQLEASGTTITSASTIVESGKLVVEGEKEEKTFFNSPTQIITFK